VRCLTLVVNAGTRLTCDVMCWEVKMRGADGIERAPTLPELVTLASGWKLQVLGLRDFQVTGTQPGEG